MLPLIPDAVSLSAELDILGELWEAIQFQITPFNFKPTKQVR